MYRPESEGEAYLSHGSGIAIPALLERLFYASENIREGTRLSKIKTPHIQPFIDASTILYVEVFGVLRSSMNKTDREPIEKEFDNVGELLDEIMKEPNERALKMDTITLYKHVNEKIIRLWFIFNDFLQGEKQFYVRYGDAKENLFAEEVKALKNEQAK